MEQRTAQKPQRRTISFADSVSPGSTVRLSKEVESPGTVTNLLVRIYRGAELDLQVDPFHKPVAGSDESLITFRGKQFVDGDGDKFEFSLSEPIREGSEIGVNVRNLDPDFAYDFSTIMTVEHFGGTQRTTSLLGGLFNGI